MKPFKAHPLRYKLIAIMVVVTGVLTFLNLAVQGYFDYQQDIIEVKQHATRHIRSLTFPISEALWDLDLEQLQQLLFSISEDEYIRNIRLTGIDGTLIEANTTLDLEQAGAMFELRYNGRYLGNLSYALDDSVIREHVMSKLAFGLLLNTLEVLVILLVMVTIISKMVTTPLLELLNLSKNINPETSSKIELPKEFEGRQDEISYVAQALQNMNNTSRKAIAAQRKTERKLLHHQSQLKQSIERQTEAYKIQSKLHRILADMSLNILTCDENNVTEVMYSAFEPIGRILDIDRLSILTIDGNTATFSYAWRSDGTRNPLSGGFNTENMPFLQRRLLSLEPIIIDNIETLKESANNEYQMLKAQNVASIAVFPLIDGKSVFGLLTASTLCSPRIWPDTQKTILSRLSTTVSELHIRLKNHREMTALQNELIEANRRLHIAAETDELTGLPNRRPFMSELIHSLESLYVSTVTIMMIDVDHFKPYNDTYGHVQGDFALRYISQALRQVLSPCGHLVARIGGEEFCALLVNVSQQESMLLAQRMRQEVEKLNIPHSSNQPHDIVTISVGMTYQQVDDHQTTSQTLLEQADKALYQAKHQGRNHVSSFEGNV